MPLGAAPPEGAVALREAGESNGRGELVRLLRTCHIFATLVREIFDGEVLRAASPHRLTPTQLQLLKLAGGDSPRRVGEVTGFLGVTPPATTKNVDKLERLGLLRRRPSPGDRRGTLLAASADGARLVAECESLEMERLARGAVALARAERAQLTRLLERLCLRLLAACDGREGPCLRCAGHFDRQCPLLGLVDGCPNPAPPAATGMSEAEHVKEVS